MTATLKKNFPRVLAKVDGDEGQYIRVNGRDGATLVKLVQKGRRGLRAYDFPGGPPFRLPAYIHDLRKEGLVIRTEREEHAPGMRHGVFYLETPVTILAVDDGAPRNGGDA
jgi:Helix-turn-helix domain